MAENGSLSAKQGALLVALLTCATLGEACAQARVSERTAHRWLADAAFRAAFHDAKTAALAQAVGRLSVVAGQAVAALEAAMSDHGVPASVRVAAARAVLDLAIKQAEVEALEARLAALEAAQEPPNRAEGSALHVV